MHNFYVGLISGTSLDGIDAALVRIDDSKLDLLQSHQHEYPEALRERLLRAVHDPDACALDELGELDTWVGECFRDAALALIDSAGIAAESIVAIGSHGQTIRHRPDLTHRFTMQIGDPATICAGTSITTVADFRRSDMALGGEGAPLTPAFHDWLFRDSAESRIVLNIGGIANITILSAGDSTVLGFDTGPGNTLLDAWVREHRDQRFDDNGTWAASGTVDQSLLSELRADGWFAKDPPKSTGFEYFNLSWLRRANSFSETIDQADVQATLSELTAISVGDAIRKHAPGASRIYVCGGGVHNADLLQRLAAQLPGVEIGSSKAAGLDPDWVEAAAFAWLAKQRLDEQPGNQPAVTGASRFAVLGAIYSP